VKTGKPEALAGQASRSGVLEPLQRWDPKGCKTYPSRVGAVSQVSNMVEQSEQKAVYFSEGALPRRSVSAACRRQRLPSHGLYVQVLPAGFEVFY
jgi:hypothetical protein